MEILEQIRRIVGCPLISDLRYGVSNRFAQWILKDPLFESCPLAELSDADAYDEKYGKWRIEDLPNLPDSWQYTVSRDKQKQMNTLRTLMHREDVCEVINACDAGREGELIFRIAYNLNNCRKRVKRLWISSMEDAAILDGFDNLRDGAEYDNLYASALCRSKADWLVGINATRLFSVMYHRTLNVGRVVSPTLALLV